MTHGPSVEVWKLRLYVSDSTPKSRRAISNLRLICSEHLAGPSEIEVVDLAVDPARAFSDDILVIPTLVRLLPESAQRIIGDLSDTDQVLLGVQITLSEESFR